MFEILIIIFCLFVNALLAGAETALIAVSKPTLRELVKQGDLKAKQLLALRENPERTLSIIQVGITFVGAFAAAIGGAGAEEFISPWLIQKFRINEFVAEIISLIIVVVPLTYISVVIGELVPKTLALRRPLFIASLAAPWLQKISLLISPLITLFEWSTKKILNSFPQKHVHEEAFPENSTVELNVLSAPNRQYVFNLLKIEKTRVKEILVTWSQVVFVEDTQTQEQIENTIITSAHTRLPVLKKDKVIGILNAKEFLAFQKTGETNWQSLLRPAYTIDVNMPILSALRLMQEKRIHMAIVYENNEKKGIVTMEAIFEEIVGDIYDEDDDGTLNRILSSISFKGKHIKRKY
ncbi:hemolysin family protein [Criblamydia sequanensis]|uniref:Conserved putative membrane protein n=1 Tax=Candidatus Criblamydia sequanensis CRIB-18 TaxID=1437425 RepID=A0A090D3C9_9BACT|nr:hemolysin family protein [Criblamydia sequanensis]CDR35163.1 Conserved putative membrane protein [Criblamydia sequanensis CRIB-18]